VLVYPSGFSEGSHPAREIFPASDYSWKTIFSSGINGCAISKIFPFYMKKLRKIAGGDSL
jgi:hypothetical protein